MSRTVPYWRKLKPVVHRADAIERHYPASSAIAALVYDEASKTCWVTFTDGASVELSDFPAIEFERWQEAASPGAYWNYHLRGRY
jgi:hypothetical protein